MQNKALIWDLPVRTFHWTLATSFTGAFLLADGERFRNIHVMFGYTVLALVVFRLVWGFIGTRYAQFRSFSYHPRDIAAYVLRLLRGDHPHYAGHNPVGSFAIWAILIFATLTGLTGYATYNEFGGDALEYLHEFCANAWLLIVGLHIGGVIVSSLLERDNLARAMVTGYKRAEPAAAIRSGAYGLGSLMLVSVLGFWIWTLVAN
ncbi:MAG: cytochrome b/b6 domain-containing protein [Gammaproteobacteria bacterium]